MIDWAEVINSWEIFRDKMLSALTRKGKQIMIDREKVIKGLEHCKKYGSLGGNDCNGYYEYTDNLQEIIKANNHRKDCPYGQCRTGCIVTLVDDILALLKDDETQLQYRDDHIAMYQAEVKRLEALLKEQEAVKPTWNHGRPFCSVCDSRIRGGKFCSECGKPILWKIDSWCLSSKS